MDKKKRVKVYFNKQAPQVAEQHTETRIVQRGIKNKHLKFSYKTGRVKAVTWESCKHLGKNTCWSFAVKERKHLISEGERPGALSEDLNFSHGGKQLRKGCVSQQEGFAARMAVSVPALEQGEQSWHFSWAGQGWAARSCPQHAPACFMCRAPLLLLQGETWAVHQNPLEPSADRGHTSAFTDL